MNITIRKVVDNVFENYKPFFHQYRYSSRYAGLNLTSFWQFLSSKIVRTVWSLNFPQVGRHYLPHTVPKFQLITLGRFRVKSKLKNFRQWRWIYTVSVFRTFSSVFFAFLLLLDKVCAFSSAFLCVHMRTNQTVTYWTKVFQKKFFVKEYSSISKYRSYRSYTKFLNKIFIYI